MLTATGGTVSVSSDASTGSGYSVSGITFPVTVAAGQSISFKVTFTPAIAGSSSGNISFVSNASNSTVAAALSGTGVQHSVSLSWTASTSVVVGYNIYRGTQSGGPYTLISPSPEPTTTYSDATVQAGATYFYVVTAVDSNSQESPFSNETAANIPTP